MHLQHHRSGSWHQILHCGQYSAGRSIVHDDRRRGTRLLCVVHLLDEEAVASREQCNDGHVRRRRDELLGERRTSSFFPSRRHDHLAHECCPVQRHAKVSDGGVGGLAYCFWRGDSQRSGLHVEIRRITNVINVDDVDDDEKAENQIQS